MTASLYRRLVDLPPGLLSQWPKARTTDEVIEAGRDPVDLAEDIRSAAQERDLRVFAAVLSNGQASEIGTPGLGKPGVWERLISRLETDAQKVRTRDQRVRNYASPHEPAVVVCLWDGRIRAEVTQRSRSRESRRYTLDAEVLTWVEAEAARREVSQSAVVQDALREGMGR